MNARICIVVPCYNEEEVLEQSAERLCEILHRMVEREKIDENSYILLVDDGSRDATWSVIEKLHSAKGEIQAIRLSRNEGHQRALLSGLLHADADAVVSIDADLQDDVDAIEWMVDAWRNGSEVVYGVRCDRSADSPFKRWTAESYYRILRLMGVETVFNHADFRLLGRRPIEALREYPERNLFLRAMVPLLGFQSSIVEYTRGKRLAGESKYPLPKMLALAWQGITSFSATPLRTITLIGFAVSLVSVALALWAFWKALFTESVVPGWASIIVPLSLLGGVNLFCMGIVGEYMAKIYLEVKGRPRYVIAQSLEHAATEKSSPAQQTYKATATS